MTQNSELSLWTVGLKAKALVAFIEMLCSRIQSEGQECCWEMRKYDSDLCENDTYTLTLFSEGSICLSRYKYRRE